MKIAGLFLFLGCVALGFAMLWQAIRRAESVDEREFVGEFFDGDAP